MEAAPVPSFLIARYIRCQSPVMMTRYRFITETCVTVISISGRWWKALLAGGMKRGTSQGWTLMAALKAVP